MLFSITFYNVYTMKIVYHNETQFCLPKAILTLHFNISELLHVTVKTCAENKDIVDELYLKIYGCPDVFAKCWK